MGRHNTGVRWQSADTGPPVQVDARRIQHPLPKDAPEIASPQPLKPAALPPLILSIIPADRKVASEEDIKLPSYETITESAPLCIPGAPKISPCPLPVTIVGTFFSDFGDKSSSNFASQVLLHDILHNTKQYLYLDLSTGFESMSFRHSEAPKYMADPATDPALKEVEIVCGTLEWSLTVKRRDRGHITCIDVLEALVCDVKGTLPESSVAGLRKGWKIISARNRRDVNEKTMWNGKVEKDSEVRKVDFLGEGTIFAGLTAVRGDSRKWRVSVVKS